MFSRYFRSSTNTSQSSRRQYEFHRNPNQPWQYYIDSGRRELYHILESNDINDDTSTEVYSVSQSSKSNKSNKSIIDSMEELILQDDSLDNNEQSLNQESHSCERNTLSLEITTEMVEQTYILEDHFDDDEENDNEEDDEYDNNMEINQDINQQTMILTNMLPIETSSSSSSLNHISSVQTSNFPSMNSHHAYYHNQQQGLQSIEEDEEEDEEHDSFLFPPTKDSRTSSSSSSMPLTTQEIIMVENTCYFKSPTSSSLLFLSPHFFCRQLPLYPKIDLYPEENYQPTPSNSPMTN